MDVRIRDLRADDRASLERLLRRVAVFEPHEIGVAMELVAGALGTSGDYLIYVAEDAEGRERSDRGSIVGYICHGHNPVTDAIHDVYWIAVDPGVQGCGVGGQLLEFVEERVRTLQWTRHRHRDVEPERICSGAASLRKIRLRESRRYRRLLQTWRSPVDLHEIRDAISKGLMSIGTRSLSIAMIYNLADQWDRVDVNSVVDGVSSIQGTLETLGHRVTLMRVSDGILPLVQKLQASSPDLIFNLCEGFGEQSSGEYCVAGLLELLGIPFTGSGPFALALALDKPTAKQLFTAAGMLTPAFSVCREGSRCRRTSPIRSS